MALEGNAKDFGLSEILQLIALQKKSGMLSVTGEDSIVIFFKEGEIISTRDRRNRAKDPLKDYLLRYGFISRDEMNKIQHIQAETNLDLTDILLSEKYFSEDEMQTIFEGQIQETIVEILSWPKSYYKFITGSNVLQGIKTFISMKVEGLLMESMRRLDEFPELRKIFPSEDVVIKRNPIPEGEKIELEGEEEIIYELLENATTIGSLVSRAKMARFCTYEALKNLLEKGLLQIIETPKEKEEEEDFEVSIEEGKKSKVFVPALAFISILIAGFFIGEFLIPTLLPASWASFNKSKASVLQLTEDDIVTLKEFKQRRLLEKISVALEEYYALKGSYPFTLEVLVVRGILPETVIDKAQEYGIFYRLNTSGSGYTLKRAKK